MEPQIQEVLDKYNVKTITTTDEILKIFDIQSLRENKPKINTDKHTLIIFDTNDFNSAFMHDHLVKVLSNKDNITELIQFPPTIPEKSLTRVITDFQQNFSIIAETIEIFYCNDSVVHEMLFGEFFKFHRKMGIERSNLPEWQKLRELSMLETQQFVQIPTLLMINSNVQEVFLDWESFAPFSEQNIISAFMTIYDAHKINVKLSKPN